MRAFSFGFVPSSLFLALLGTGCATTLSSFQTAEPTQPGHVQVVTGAGFYGPLGTSLDLISQGEDLAEKLGDRAKNGEQIELSESEQNALITSGIALAVLPPSPSYEVGVRTGLTTDWDLGLRYSVNAVRLDTKYRLFHRGNLPPEPLEGDPAAGTDAPPAPVSERSTDLAIGFGVSKYLFSNPVFDVLEYVKLGDFSRWDFEIPIYASHRVGHVFKVYGGPRYLYSRVNLDTELVKISAEGEATAGVDLRIPSLVHMHFFGGTAGIAVGYRYVHLMLEMTAGYTRCSPVLLGERRSLGGATLYPAVGLGLSF